MNAAERDQLQQFLTALRQNRTAPKDPVADALIREALASQPDAPYWLVQRVMGLGLALDAAHTRILQLEASSAQPQAVAQQVGASTWGRGLMAQAASTAAGVVAGGLLFQGVQSLMGHGDESPASPLGNAAPESLSVPVSPVATSTEVPGGSDSPWDQGDDWA